MIVVEYAINHQRYTNGKILAVWTRYQNPRFGQLNAADEIYDNDKLRPELTTTQLSRFTVKLQ